jgi:siroheme synthase
MADDAAHLDYAALVVISWDVRFLHGSHHGAAQWVPALIAAGKSGRVPRRRWYGAAATRSDDVTSVSSRRFRDLIRDEQHIRPPVVMIVGDVVRWGQTWGQCRSAPTVRSTHSDYSAA